MTTQYFPQNVSLNTLAIAFAEVLEIAPSFIEAVAAVRETIPQDTTRTFGFELSGAVIEYFEDGSFTTSDSNL